MMPSLDVIQQYAPDVAPQTIAAIIRVESGGNQFALGINCRFAKRTHPKSAGEAAALARYFISKGYSVDLGLMQINSRNLRGLGLTIEQAFDAGANIQAGAKILARGYRGAVKRFGPGQNALRAALSAYNTGNYERGFKNGYVAKYFSNARWYPGFECVVAKLPSHAEKFRQRNIGNTATSRILTSNPFVAELPVYSGSKPSESVAPDDSSSTGAKVSVVPPGTEDNGDGNE